jgi:hypothetical protein
VTSRASRSRSRSKRESRTQEVSGALVERVNPTTASSHRRSTTREQRDHLGSGRPGRKVSWRRETDTELNTVARAADPAALGEQTPRRRSRSELIGSWSSRSPLQVRVGRRPDGRPGYYGGALIDVSTDGGNTWRDASARAAAYSERSGRYLEPAAGGTATSIRMQLGRRWRASRSTSAPRWPVSES